MNMNPYVMEMEARQKQWEMATGIRSPKKLRPSIYHRIRSWFTTPPPLETGAESLPPNIVPYRSGNSNLVFLQLYRGRRPKGCHSRPGRGLSRHGFRN